MATKNTLHITSILIDFFFKKFIDFLLLVLNFFIPKMLLNFPDFFLSIFVFEKIASQQIRKNTIRQQEKRTDQSP
jgi:hypothetical protein